MSYLDKLVAGRVVVAVARVADASVSYVMSSKLKAPDPYSEKHGSVANCQIEVVR